MSIIDEALQANARLSEGFDAARGGPPAPKIAIVTCADPRLTAVVQLMGLPDADVDLIRNVGTVIDDDSIRSLIVSTRMLGTQEIMIINHNDCGLTRFSGDELESRLRAETGSTRSRRPASSLSRTPRRTPGSRCGRCARTRGSRPRSRCAGSSTT